MILKQIKDKGILSIFQQGQYSILQFKSMKQSWEMFKLCEDEQFFKQRKDLPQYLENPW